MTGAREFLAAVQARAEAATDGPWVAGEGSGCPMVFAGDLVHEIDYALTTGGRQQGFRDAEFIAATRTDVPRLVAALTAVLDLADDWDGMCRECAYDLRAVIEGALTNGDDE